MIDVALEDATLRAVDPVGHTLAIDVVGWDDSADPTTIPVAGIDEVVAGHVTELVFDDYLMEYGNGDAEDFQKLQEAKCSVDLDDPPTMLKATSQVGAHLLFDAPATLERLADGRARLAFEHPTPVTIGYWSLVDYPEETITVEPTASGLATALTALSSAYLTSTADRTLPGWREYPPLLEFGEETHVPSTVEDATPDSGIELVLPDEFAYCIPATPLAFHLSATVRVEDRDAPVLRAPGVDVERSFAPLPEFQFEANDLFERTFYADCLVNSSRGASDIVESDFLPDVGLDPDDLYDAPLADRLAAYLDAPLETIRTKLPRRTYVGFVDSTPTDARALPHLCHYEARTYLPSAYETIGAGNEANVTSAWVADGVRDDTFAASPVAYDNHLAYLEAGLNADEPHVHVLGNDDDDRSAHVEACYRDSEGALDAVVSRRDDCTTTDLVDAFAARRALLHVVDDDAADGIQCRDGTVALDAVEDVGARIVVLDLATDGIARDAAARTGRALVDAGAVAVLVRTGAVTDRAIEAFTAMILQTFGVELSRRMVDRYVDGAFDALVAGDGTHTLHAQDSVNYIPLEVSSNDDTTYEVTGKVGGPTAGLFWHADVTGVRSRLLANDIPFELSSTELASLVADPGYLLIYEDDLYWSNELTPFYPAA